MAAEGRNVSVWRLSEARASHAVSGQSKVRPEAYPASVLAESFYGFYPYGSAGWEVAG
jgi:hypothetical protein